MNREKDKIRSFYRISHLLTLSVYIERFQSRDQRLCKFIGTTALVWDTNMAAIPLFWNTNMADVTSCKDTLYCVEFYPSTVSIDPVSGVTL